MTDDISGFSRTDGRLEMSGTDDHNPLMIGSRVLLISRGLEKRVVGDTIDIVRVFVTPATIPEVALILRMTSGAQTLSEVVHVEPINWTLKDLVRHP
ncbi:uncharacterized protein LOC127241510 isoform X2 [Andrographis paniculata]|uniref:uncharacterized protein LOC127241510 isoform X2 n=1 Tax=Andrographis paniculata TaxID=175694 RepID=UPI0021E95395|nr:uncharacterized protein LOC127241510 isoform X2 [Andrographis paniculata]